MCVLRQGEAFQLTMECYISTQTPEKNIPPLVPSARTMFDTAIMCIKCHPFPQGNWIILRATGEYSHLTSDHCMVMWKNTFTVSETDMNHSRTDTRWPLDTLKTNKNNQKKTERAFFYKRNITQASPIKHTSSGMCFVTIPALHKWHSYMPHRANGAINTTVGQTFISKTLPSS